MEINKIHSDLKEIYKDIKVKRKFSIEFDAEDQKVKLIQLLRKGYWSVMPFGFYGYEDSDILAIRLIPDKSIKKSPVVSFDDVYEECFTFAPDLKAIIPMSYLRFMHDSEVIAELQEKIEGAVNLSKPFFDYLGDGDLGFLRQFLLSEANQERFKNAVNLEDTFYKEFWDHYYDTPEQEKAFQLFEKLKEKRTYLPDYKSTDYGLWNEYVGNVLAQRALGLLNMEYEDKWQHLWHCAQLPHGFDCDNNGFDHYKISLGNSDSLISHLSFSFDSGWEDQCAMFPEKVQKHPLFEATEAIRIKGQYGYAGEKHLETASRLEEKYKDPFAAWNALISASYWAGKRERLDLVEKAWEQAIGLSERNGWVEIHHVLSEQMEFYNHYKDQF